MRRWYYTIQGRYFALLAMILAAALLVTGIINQYFATTFRRQELANHVTALENYNSQLYATMSAIRTSTSNMINQDSTFDEMQYLTEYDEHMMAKREIFARLGTHLIQYPQIESCFAYSSHSGDFLYRDREDIDYFSRLDLMNDIRGWLAAETTELSSDWHVHTSGEETYLVYLYHNETAYAGCLIKISGILTEALLKETGAGAAFLQNGSVAETTGDIQPGAEEPEMLLASGHYQQDGKTYYIAVAPIGKTEFTITCLTPSDTKMSVPMYVVLWAIVGFLAVVIPAIFALSAFSFTRPVRALVGVMNQVADGDLSARVQVENLSKLQEFRLIGESYNRSLEQISALTNENLERQKAYQKAQLNALQMQINPHFLMNSLNIMYIASCARKSRIVQEMCLHLSGYYRYSMSSNRDLVPLAEELRFTEDYLHIMKLRFENAFSYEVAVPPFLKNALVPPMIMKIFVENSVKYAVTPQRQVELLIQAELLSEGDNACLKLVIEDNGPGYPPEMLGTQEEIFRYDTDRHTGIRNVYDRIRLLFGREAQLRLGSRKDGGASTWILIPLRMEEENVSGAAD